MKNIYNSLAFILIITTIYSCSNNELPKDNASSDASESETLEPDPTYGFRAVSLAEHELDINVFIPEKFYDDEDGLPRFVPTNIKHNLGEARWEITLAGDKRWHLVIEELGNNTSSVEQEMVRLKDVEFFDYNFKVKTDSTLLFSRSLKADKTTLDTNERTQSANYQFYCNRMINGYNLVFKNYELKDFRKLTVDKMLTSALNSY